MIEFSAAVQSVKVLGDILKSAHELKDSTALVAAVNEVHNKLSIAYESVINSQEKRLALQERITELEKELDEIKDWKAEAQRYKLAEIASGVFAFVTKPGMENGEPAHKLCTVCHGKRQKGYLQRTSFNTCGTSYKCSNCGAEILDHSYRMPSPTIPFPTGERF